MNPVRRQRLLAACAIGISLAAIVTLALNALETELHTYRTPSEIATGDYNPSAALSVGGLVVADSLTRLEGLSVSFRLTDFEHEVSVRYTGILPDLFKEGAGAVADGRMQGDVFVAERVLAKHDEEYRPRALERTFHDKTP